MSLGRAGGGRSQKDQLVFSSEDSLNSNNSFASSVDEEDNKEDFANHFLNLKDQMEMFLTQNPQLNEAMKFQPFREPTSDEEIVNHNDGDSNSHSQGGGGGGNQGFNPYGRINKANAYKGPKIEHRNIEEIDKLRKRQQLMTSSSSDEDDDSESIKKGSGLGKKKKGVTFNTSSGGAGASGRAGTHGSSSNTEKSKLWSSLTKDVVRIGQFGCKTPTLETVNHRLNIFKTKIEKIDYLDYLQKEMISSAGGQIPQMSTSNSNAVLNSNVNAGTAAGGGTIIGSGVTSNTNLLASRNDGNANNAGDAATSGGVAGSTAGTMIGQSSVGGGMRQSLSTNVLLSSQGLGGVNGMGGSTVVGMATMNAANTTEKGNGTAAGGGSGGGEQGDDDDNSVGRDSDGNLIYFSFKKRMQTQLQKKIEKTNEKKSEETKLRQREALYNTGVGGRRANMVSRGAIDAKKLIREQELMEKKRKAANPDLTKEIAKQNRKSFTGLKAGSGETSLSEEHIVGHDKDAGLQFQTRVGIALYQTYQQCAGDKESFKKTANFILKDYNKTKQQFFKKKPFPPATIKFTNEETKALNVYLPDFTSNLYAPNKANLFANIDSFELPMGTPEAEFISVVDKILDGAVLKFWKETQNQQQ